MESKPQVDSHELLTYRAAGKLIGVSHTTIGKWVRGGHLASVKMPGSRNRRVLRGTLVQMLRDLESLETLERSESQEN